MSTRLLAALAGVAVATTAATADIVVFETAAANGWFTPFSANTPAGTLYGDSGWLGGPAAPPVELTSITLKLAVNQGQTLGSTDLVFTFNDGDPSGFVFGSGATLYSTIVPIVLPESSEGPSFFSVDIPIPGVVTAGGFNNIGWSVGVQNFSYDGFFGFETAAGAAQPAGFFTFAASEYSPSFGWSTFSFSGAANFGAIVYAVPAPSAAAVLGLSALAIARRRR